MSSPHFAHPEDDNPTPTRPFWRNLGSFVLFPLQVEPLIYAIVLALCSLLVFIPPLMLLTPLLMLWAVSRYAFKVAALASIGITRCEDYSHNLRQEEWAGLSWRLFVVVLVHFFLLTRLSSVGTLLLGMLMSALLLPATLMVLIIHKSLRMALNPLQLWLTISRIEGNYWLLCFFLFLVLEALPWLVGLLDFFAPKALVLPVRVFSVIYGIWVTAAMIGHVIYRYREALDLVPLDQLEDKHAIPQDPDAVEMRWRDAQVEQWLQAGNLPKALTAARDWLGKSHDLQATLADHRRYHRLLKLAKQPQVLTEHANVFIPLLLQASNHKDEALAVWQSCRKRDKDFQPASADATLILADHAWHIRQKAPVTLALLQGFEKQFPGNASTPQALELMVYALHQGLNDTMRAQRVYTYMKTHWPKHPCTHKVSHILHI